MKLTKIPSQKLIGIGSLLLLMLLSGRAQIVFIGSGTNYEPFSEWKQNEFLGTNDGTGDTSGTVWGFGDSVTGSSARITTNAALSYLGLMPDPVLTAERPPERHRLRQEPLRYVHRSHQRDRLCLFPAERQIQPRVHPRVPWLKRCE